MHIKYWLSRNILKIDNIFDTKYNIKKYSQLMFYYLYHKFPILILFI